MIYVMMPQHHLHLHPPFHNPRFANVATNNELLYQLLLISGFCVATGYYFTGDSAYRTKEGYYQITGRMDDVINVSGHRLGTAEIEDAMVIFSNA